MSTSNNQWRLFRRPIVRPIIQYDLLWVDGAQNEPGSNCLEDAASLPILLYAKFSLQDSVLLAWAGDSTVSVFVGQFECQNVTYHNNVS